MRIGIDLDGVCYEWQRTALYMLRAYRGYSREELGGTEDWRCWDWHKTKISSEDNAWLWSIGVTNGLFRYGHLYPGTIKALNELSDIGDLVILTHRPKTAILDTIDWLAFNKIKTSETHILYNQEPKSGVKPECDVYIDDSLVNVDDLVRNTKGRVFLWTRPWNLGSSTNAIRISSWDDLVKRAKGEINVSI